MNKDLKIRKQLLTHPGDTLKETIDTLGMSQKELAERLGKNKKNVNRIIKGIEAISYSTALALEKVLGIPADFWLERERIYRKELAEIESDEAIQNSHDWIKKFPVKEMIGLNWLPNVFEPLVTMKALLNYFGIASPEQWEQIYLPRVASVTFRMSLAFANHPEAISAWLRKGELDARHISVNEYSKANFRDILPQIKDVAYKHPVDFKEKLQQLCLSAGVVVIYTPKIPKASISGASRWVYNSIPLIQLTDKFKTNNHFWFTFFHEAGHILLHGKKDVFLEEVEDKKLKNAKETEADNFANEWLFNDNQFAEVVNDKPFTADKIRSYAKKFETHPAIIVGRLQHDGVIRHSVFNELKVNINLFE